jgi:hypothetical protein
VWVEAGDVFIGKFKGSQATTPASDEDQSESSTPASTPGKRRLSTPRTYTPRKKANTSAAGLIGTIKSGGKLTLCDHGDFSKVGKGT